MRLKASLALLLLLQAYFCLFNGANRTAGSLVSAPLSDPTALTVLVDDSLSTLNGAPFGDALPKFALDKQTRKLFFVVFAVGISWIDLDDLSAGSTALLMLGGSSMPVILSLALLPSLPALDGTGAHRNATLMFASLTGNIDVVSSDGGEVTRLSSPCVFGGCRYRQLWDMKVVPPTPSMLERGVSTVSVLAAWIRVTNLAGSSATVLTASVYRLEPTAGPDGNWTAVNATSLYTTDRQGGTGLTVLPNTASPGGSFAGCTGFFTQSRQSPVFGAPMAGIKPMTQFSIPQYGGFALDKPRRRAFWWQQDPNAGLQLMSAGADNLSGGTIVLSSVCHAHEGALVVDPASGDAVFQSSAGTGSVTHYCYRSATNPEPRLFYVETQAYQGVNIAVDWQRRVMYVSGTGFVSGSTIRRVMLDAKDPAANPEVVIAQNTSASSIAVVGGRLFYVVQSSYGLSAFQNYTLYSCTPPSLAAPAAAANACDVASAKIVSTVGRAFADQFSSVELVSSMPDGSVLLVRSSRGNSVAQLFNSYTIATDTWAPLYVSPFSNPVAIGGDPSRLSFIDGTTSAFGSFIPLGDPNSFNVPFVITGEFSPMSSLASRQSYPSGPSGQWGVGFVAGVSKWFWFSSHGSGNDRAWSIYQGAMAGNPEFKLALKLTADASTEFLAVDETASDAFYVVNVPERRPGPAAASPCNPYGSVSGAQNLVRASFSSDGAAKEAPTVVLQQPNGICFASQTPALDAAGQKLYFTELAMGRFGSSTPYLAVLDLTTGVKRRFTVAGLSFLNLGIMKLSDDGRTLWSWGCVSLAPCTIKAGTPRLVVIGNITTHGGRSVNATYWNTSIPGLSSTMSSSGLQDFTIRKQPNRTAFSFVAYNPGHSVTTRPVRGVYEGNAVPGGVSTVRSLLQPVDVKVVDVDFTDAANGLLIAPFPPDDTVVLAPPPLAGILLLRGPVTGVGLLDGNTLVPQMIPWPTGLPAELRDPNIVQLAHLPPHRLVFTFGRHNCISDEIWAVNFDDAADGPTLLVSALLMSSSPMLRSQTASAGGVQLSWTKCASRIVIADVPAGAAVDAPLDYTSLEFAWLDIPIEGRPSISSFAQVGNTFIFVYSTKSVIYSAELVRDRHVFEHVTLLSNDSSWYPVSTVVHGSTVYIGERNVSAYSVASANGRLRSIDLSAAVRLGAAPATIEIYLDNTAGVDNLGTMPASCLPPQIPATPAPSPPSEDKWGCAGQIGPCVQMSTGRFATAEECKAVTFFCSIRR